MGKALKPMKEPRVSIGLPVYNGERYLRNNLDSLLAQTFTDFEVVISDNASTDRTPEICRDYVAQDPRVCYFSNEENRGISWNHNNVFSLSQGEYFLWIGHDDLLAPQYLERCVAILDTHPSVVLCYSRSQRIDEHGQCFADKHHDLATESENRLVRFRDLVCVPHSSLAMFGVMRTEVLRKTILYEYHISADRVLLAQLGLFGCFHQIPEPLFFRRTHSGQSTNSRRHIQALQFDPKRAGSIVLPRWEMYSAYLSCLRKTPLSRYERLRCTVLVLKAIQPWWRELRDDVLVAIKHVLIGNH